jgi:asparaginyl-tRNA synthetase
MTDYTTIQDAMDKGEGQVSLQGWAHRERGSNKLKFILLRDHTNLIQCVIDRNNFEEQWDEIDHIQIETSLRITGTIVKDERAPTGYEVQVTNLEIVGKSDNFPIGKDFSVEFLADNRHLWLRSRKMSSMMKIRSTIFGAIHEYFRMNKFIEYQSPILQAVQCEGGSTLFTVDYYKNKDVFLGQTWQLYAEPAIFSVGNIYTIAPSFRAEKSKTSRHLSEYWHAEMEMVWNDYEDLKNHAEGLIKHVFKKVLENNLEELKELKRDIEKIKPIVEKPFIRMTYDEALVILKEKCGMEIEWGKDLRTIEEEKLTKLYDVPIICTDYPKEVKAFYMIEKPDNPKVVLGFDMLAPEGYGEIIGASQREHDIEKLKQRLIDGGENLDHYEFYLDTRKYGTAPHGGFGLGVERLITWICGFDNIKDSIPFPRNIERYKP